MIAHEHAARAHLKPRKQLAHREVLMAYRHIKRDKRLTTLGSDTDRRHAGRDGSVVHGGEYAARAIVQDLQFLDFDLFHDHTEILTAAT